jgi:glycosyltransferase involved in cell wall biosynthesis
VRKIIGNYRKLLGKVFSFKLAGRQLLYRTLKVLGNVQTQTSLIQMKVFLEKPSKSTKKLLLFFPVVTWASRTQRPQHIAREFRNDGFLVLYPTMAIQKRRDSDIDFELLEEGIYQLWLHGSKKLNLYQDTISELDLKNILTAFRKVIDAINPVEIVIFVEYPIWGPLAAKIKETFPGASLLYDCLDDHQDFKNANSAIYNLESFLLERSDLVLTSSQVLFDKLLPLSSSIKLVRNACDFNFFKKHESVNTNRVKVQQVVGYFGAISDWFDESLVYFAAIKLPQVKFKLIGATTGGQIHELQKLPNVEVTGEMSYDRLPAELREFDVAIIPFKIQPLTNATNPVKIYEYFSQGKPVVAVNLPELKMLETLCYVAHDREEFVRHLELALVENNQELESRRIAFAAANQWSSRYSEIKLSMDKIKK